VKNRIPVLLRIRFATRLRLATDPDSVGITHLDSAMFVAREFWPDINRAVLHGKRLGFMLRLREP
jgi:hypothetical protein